MSPGMYANTGRARLGGLGHFAIEFETRMSNNHYHQSAGDYFHKIADTLLVIVRHVLFGLFRPETMSHEKFNREVFLKIRL